MTRIDIINLLISKHNYKTYLEIGVRNPDDCLNHIQCELKHGVDPGVEGDYPVTFNMTSDEFFQINTSTYDIIFIDGLHIDEQVERDIINGLNVLSENGSIVLHDCNPPQIYHAREDYQDHSTPAGPYWNGTTWKAIVKVRSEVNNIYTSVVDTDWGVGVIQKSKTPNMIVNDNPYYSYNKFLENRKEYLNLITPQEFLETYIDTNKITFIIPSVNRPSLMDSIDSLLNQSNPNWKCIVIYDGVDGPEFSDERIKTINTEKLGVFGDINGQSGLVRNVGIKIVNTKWVGFLDDDDTLHFDYVKDLFEKYSNYDFVLWRMIYENGLILPKLNTNEIIRGQVGISFCYQNKFENLYFDSNKDGEDFDFLSKLQSLTTNYIITPEMYYNVGNTTNIPKF
jgi:hypothetical protein